MLMPNLVRGEGPVPCTWLVLGEAPGATEEEVGRPFVGRSGSLLRDALREAGVRPEEVYITNAYKIRPPGNRAPVLDELHEHNRFLVAELDQVEPARVLVVGNTALHVMVPDAPGITKVRGDWLVAEAFSVMPTWHPAYVLRNPKEKETFYADVRKFIA